ncbi:hypothetical protein R4Y45_06565 [Holzapfeliella sp. He02]|uniref:Uncharacterized protein n=1 Tax=Holzapfeliella saturejae TaxID=3082953 RepID=A0ABU8SHR9_9LACO
MKLSIGTLQAFDFLGKQFFNKIWNNYQIAFYYHDDLWVGEFVSTKNHNPKMKTGRQLIDNIQKDNSDLSIYNLDFDLDHEHKFINQTQNNDSPAVLEILEKREQIQQSEIGTKTPYQKIALLNEVYPQATGSFDVQIGIHNIQKALLEASQLSKNVNLGHYILNAKKVGTTLKVPYMEIDQDNLDFVGLMSM